MNSRTAMICAATAAIASLAAIGAALGHPSSGIVVDQEGNVFFSDLSRGLLKIDPQGKVTTIADEGGHWLTWDAQGSFFPGRL